MPKEFESCVSSGGRVRTINPKRGKYMHVCFKGGKSVAGEVKTAKQYSHGSGPFTDADMRRGYKRLSALRKGEDY